MPSKGHDDIVSYPVEIAALQQAAAKCAPSRSSILTGRNSWQFEEVANHVNHFPSEFMIFPKALREHDYCAAKTGKGRTLGNPGMMNGALLF